MSIQSKLVLASLLLVLTCPAAVTSRTLSASSDPAAADYSGNKGKTIYVSKSGDNSDGSSWQKAFQTVQAALSAVPDDWGGHQIIIRPDRYAESNLYTNHKGAAVAYNLITGDFDGKLGSGATGWVVLDCSAPGAAAGTDSNNSGDTQTGKPDSLKSGFRSVEGWGNFAGPPGAASNLSYDRRMASSDWASGLSKCSIGLFRRSRRTVESRMQP